MLKGDFILTVPKKGLPTLRNAKTGEIINDEKTLTEIKQGLTEYAAKLEK